MKLCWTYKVTQHELIWKYPISGPNFNILIVLKCSVFCYLESVTLVYNEVLKYFSVLLKLVTVSVLMLLLSVTLLLVPNDEPTSGVMWGWPGLCCVCSAPPACAVTQPGPVWPELPPSEDTWLEPECDTQPAHCHLLHHHQLATTPTPSPTSLQPRLLSPLRPEQIFPQKNKAELSDKAKPNRGWCGLTLYPSGEKREMKVRQWWI